MACCCSARRLPSRTKPNSPAFPGAVHRRIFVLPGALFGLPTFPSDFPSVAFFVAGRHVYFTVHRVTRWITLWDIEVIHVKTDPPGSLNRPPFQGNFRVKSDPPKTDRFSDNEDPITLTCN